MIRKTILAAALALSPLAFSEQSSAGDCYSRGHRAYGAPVVTHRHHYGYHRLYQTPYPPYRTHYGSGYGSRYNTGYRYGYGGHGGPYYGHRSRGYYGGSRSGISLHFGF